MWNFNIHQQITKKVTKAHINNKEINNKQKEKFYVNKFLCKLNFILFMQETEKICKQLHARFGKPHNWCNMYRGVLGSCNFHSRIVENFYWQSVWKTSLECKMKLIKMLWVQNWIEYIIIALKDVFNTKKIHQRKGNML